MSAPERGRGAGFDPASRFAWVEAPARWSRAVIPVATGREEGPAVECPRCGWLEARGVGSCENCGGSLSAPPDAGPAVEYVAPLGPRVEVRAGPHELGTLDALRAELARARTPGLDALAVPPSGETRAHAHQARAVLRALGPLRGRALFADEPGLGKTAAAVLTLREWLARAMVSRVLVLAPKDALARWAGELALRGVGGFARAERRHEAGELGPLVLAPWGLVDRDPTAALLTERPWDAVVADDAGSLAEPSNARHGALARCAAPYLLLVSRDGLPREARGVEALCSLLRARDEGAPHGDAGLRERIAACAVHTRRSGHDVSLAPRAIGRLDVAVEPAEAALWSTIRQEISRPNTKALWLGALRALCAGPPALRAFVEESRASAPRAKRLHALARALDEVREGAALRGLALALRELAPLVDGPVAVLASHDGAAAEARAFLARHHKGLPRAVCAGPGDLRSERGPHGAAAVRACHALVHLDLPFGAGALERRVARVIHAGSDPSRPVPVLAVCTDEGTARWFALHADGTALGGLGPSELAFVERSLGGEQAFADRVALAVADPERFEALARECSVARAALQAPRTADAANDAVDDAGAPA